MKKAEKIFGYCKQGVIFQSAWAKNPDREIGKVKDNDEAASILYFEDRFKELQSKLNELIQKVDETNNKGSFLMKLIHLRDTLHQHDGIGDYGSLFERVVATISSIEAIIESNRQRNTEIKKALITEIKVSVELVNWKEATEKVLEAKEKWIKTGSAKPEAQKALDSEFWDIVKAFYERKLAFFEDKKRLAAFYETKYKELITEAEHLTLDGKGKVAEKINSLKERWKANGPVPVEKYTELLKLFNKAIKPTSNFRICTNLPELLTQLENINTQKTNLTPTEIQQIQNALRNIRPNNADDRKVKEQCNMLVFLINERSFLHSICVKKYRNFTDKNIEEQNQLKSQIIKELIERDTNELRLIELNQENFNVTNPKVHEMMEKKLHYQKQKIVVKQKLLLESLPKNQS